jgi:hypothetical protein
LRVRPRKTPWARAGPARGYPVDRRVVPGEPPWNQAAGAAGGELATLQVGDALSAFQRALQNIEASIQRKTALGERTPYTTLLPSLIPQSINI